VHLELKTFPGGKGRKGMEREGEETGEKREGELGMKRVEWEEEREGSGREVSIAKVNDSPPPLTSW